MRTAKQMKKKEISSLINMVSKGKPQLPFLFVTGGLDKLIAFNLVSKKKDEVPSSNLGKPEPYDLEHFKEMQKSQEDKPKLSVREKLLRGYKTKENAIDMKKEQFSTQCEEGGGFITVKTDKSKMSKIKIQFCTSISGRTTSKLAKNLILMSYPKADIEMVEDTTETSNLIQTVNDKVVFDKLGEGDRDFRNDMNDLIIRVKHVAEEIK